MTGDETSGALRALLAGGDRGVLATLRRNGLPQLSTVTYHFDPRTEMIRVSTTAGRAKVANMRRDPRVSLHASTADGWSYAVADGQAQLTPVAAAEDDDIVAELVQLYRDVNGEHPDWAEYRQVMVADRRLVVRLRVERIYGLIQQPR